MMRFKRQAYVVNLQALQAQCSHNYWLLQRLTAQQDIGTQVSIVSNETEQCEEMIQIYLLNRASYTSMFRLSQGVSLTPWSEPLTMLVHLYHDVNMAEVIKVRNWKNFEGRYRYPNENMLHPDEKLQLNQFLGEWLSHSVRCGYQRQTMPVFPIEVNQSVS